jgi:hypothetical protein
VSAALLYIMIMLIVAVVRQCLKVHKNANFLALI